MAAGRIGWSPIDRRVDEIPRRTTSYANWHSGKISRGPSLHRQPGTYWNRPGEVAQFRLGAGS